MTTPLMDRLAALRPEPTMTAGEEEALLARVLGADRSPHRTDRRMTATPRRRRGRLTVGVAIALGAAAAVALPAALPTDAPGSASPAAAAALRQLALIAARPAPSLAPGPTQYRHLLIVGEQTGEQGRSSQRIESWTSVTGWIWQSNVTVTNGRREADTYLFAPGGDDFSAPSPGFLRSLPIDPEALQRYLRDHVSGSSSTDEAVFVAVGDMLRGGFAPASLRAAAIGVLARTPHVTLGSATHDSLGRPVQAFDYVDDSKRPGEVTWLLFDRRTAQIVGEGTDAPDLHFRSVVERADVVDAVPAQIRRTARPQK